MKIPPRQIDSFVKQPSPDVRVALVYGPDRGLVSERLKALGLTVVDDYNDPFNVSVINGDDLAADPAKLGDEANAISMMGGRRLIRIENVGEKIVPALKEYLANPNSEALIIIEAEELTPRSSLRKLCENASNAAAIPCYVEGERDLLAVIRNMASEQSYTIASDALQWLAVNLQGDRGRVRSEIEKLLLFMGDEKNITLEIARNCCGEAGAQNLDTLIFAVADNKSSIALQAFTKLKAEGVPDIVILRSLQNHFRRLHLVKAKVMDGATAETAIKSLQPPVFFKYDQQFRSQVSRWSIEKIEFVLKKLFTLESQCKQSRMPIDTLCSQTILGVSKL